MNEEQSDTTGAMDSHEDGRQLIMQAFEAARRSGRSNWTEMTTAVLKNRLLDATDRAFRESDYGTRNIAAFVKEYPDLLTLDNSTIPPKVRLIDASWPQDTKATVVNRGRIRPDLWRSIMDYRSDGEYRWNGSRAILLYSPFSEEEKTLPTLPTISREEVAEWRVSFQEALRESQTLNDQELEQLQTWARDGLPTNKLPLAARSKWNEHLNKQVVERLASWFRENSLPVPDDLVQQRTAERKSDHIGTGQLREFILRCVRSMTEDELKAINLPPAAVLRAYGSGEAGLRDALGKQRGEM
ncbi:hypothetical protein AB0D62_16265 [Streptomyces massasporeus]|uniref:hypothetical protein n=1 Tax=Streptomyces massasporeus TaxID=67324 RepID=UPI0033F0F4A5